ncbi:MAG: helix-turn-helix transcriptional regulator [Clostridiales bacterium]|nr:helix-turn-helix transcriptional regulator [Clostridiales bacterium]
MKERGYPRRNGYKISSSTLSRLRRNMPISTVTIDDLCSILNCRVEDILQYCADPEEESGENDYGSGKRKGNL